MPIFTKLLRRDTLPARIKAQTPSRGQAVYVVYDEALSPHENHIAALNKLAAKLHWHDRHYLAGLVPEGFVFVPCDVTEPHTHHNTLLPHACQQCST